VHRALFDQAEMGHMMAAVPGVEASQEFQVPNAGRRMRQGALPLVFGQRAEQCGPTGMQATQEFDRRLNRPIRRVREQCPALFIVGVHDEILFGEREADAQHAAQVAVGEVMYHLPRGPAAFTIRPIQPARRQCGEGRFHLCGQGGDVGNPLRSLARGSAVKFSNGVLDVHDP